MANWIDITMPIAPDMAVWPGNDEPELKRTDSYDDGADSITSVFVSDLHNGTHVDAPLHFIEGGATVDSLDIESMSGPAVVVHVTGVDEVTADVLQKKVPQGAERVLLRTDNSVLPRRTRKQFDTSYVALTADASRWVAASGIKLIGVDYLSVALYDGDPETHRALLRNGVTILEGLVLDEIDTGAYDLRCMPILVVGGEAAPTRAMIKPR